MIPEEIKKKIWDKVKELEDNFMSMHPQTRSWIKKYCKETGEFGYLLAQSTPPVSEQGDEFPHKKEFEEYLERYYPGLFKKMKPFSAQGVEEAAKEKYPVQLNASRNDINKRERDAFLAGASWIQSQSSNPGNNGWIRVEDGLPEVGHSTKYPKASVDVLVSDGRLVVLGYYEDGEWVETMTDEVLDEYKITHWQSLPTPPPNPEQAK